MHEKGAAIKTARPLLKPGGGKRFTLFKPNGRKLIMKNGPFLAVGTFPVPAAKRAQGAERLASFALAPDPIDSE